MSRWQYQAGQSVHGYTLLEPLGAGGSGEVWRARRPDSADVALKILTTKGLCKILRFVREVEIMEAIDARIALPIGTVVLPGCSTPPACYSMPLAQPIKDNILKSRSGMAERIQILRSVANSIASLHERRLFHCDIKPGNIFSYRNHWILGDFGLSLRPGLRPLMEPNELIGTRLYIAPELQGPVDPDRCDWAKCDVYSLAKTAWVILAGRKRPQRGPHDPADPAQSLYGLLKERPGSAALDDLLFEATSLNADRRPSAAVFAKSLGRWLTDYVDRPPPRTQRPPSTKKTQGAASRQPARTADQPEIIPIG